MCPEVPEATCTDDYCGGCNTRWMLEGEDVTDQCCEFDAENRSGKLMFPRKSLPREEENCIMLLCLVIYTGC